MIIKTIFRSNFIRDFSVDERNCLFKDERNVKNSEVRIPLKVLFSVGFEHQSLVALLTNVVVSLPCTCIILIPNYDKMSTCTEGKCLRVIWFTQNFMFCKNVWHASNWQSGLQCYHGILLQNMTITTLVSLKLELEPTISVEVSHWTIAQLYKCSNAQWSNCQIKRAVSFRETARIYLRERMIRF